MRLRACLDFGIISKLVYSTLILEKENSIFDMTFLKMKMKSNENMFDRIFYKTKFSTIHQLIQIVFIFLIFYYYYQKTNEQDYSYWFFGI